MLEKLVIFDIFILFRVEGFSHWAQQLIGVKSTGWERVAWMLCVAAQLDGFNHRQVTEPAYIAASNIASTLLSLQALYFFYRTFDRDREQGDGEERTANPRKYTECLGRAATAVCACLMLPTFVGSMIEKGEFVFHLLWILFYTLALYFRACDDLPPGMCRLKKFLLSLLPHRQLVPVREES